MIYIVTMAKGPAIRIDEEDLQKIKNNIKEEYIQVKQGIINTSKNSLISITPTDEPDVYLKPIIERNDDKGTVYIARHEEVKLLTDKMTKKNEILDLE